MAPARTSQLQNLVLATTPAPSNSTIDSACIPACVRSWIRSRRASWPSCMLVAPRIRRIPTLMPWTSWNAVHRERSKSPAAGSRATCSPLPGKMSRLSGRLALASGCRPPCADRCRRPPCSRWRSSICLETHRAWPCCSRRSVRSTNSQNVMRACFRNCRARPQPLSRPWTCSRDSTLQVISRQAERIIQKTTSGRVSPRSRCSPNPSWGLRSLVSTSAGGTRTSSRGRRKGACRSSWPQLPAVLRPSIGTWARR